MGSAFPRRGSWGEDGNILFAAQQTPLMRVSSSGGTPVPATELDTAKHEATNRFGQLLPGDEAFVFTASEDNNEWENATIQVQTIKGGKRKTLVTGGYFGRYMPASDGTGYLVYVHEGSIFAAPMDLKRLELTGPASPVLEDVSIHANNGFPQLGFTPTGTLVYVAGSSTRDKRLIAFVDSSGNVQALPAAPAEYVNVRPSPDGTLIAVGILDASGNNLSVYEWGKNRMNRLTFIKGVGVNTPTWTPDSKHIVFPVISKASSGSGLYWMRADGAGEPQLILEGSSNLPYSFSSDGKRLAYAHVQGPEFGIWTLPLDMTDPERPKPGKPELFLTSKSLMLCPAFSPDGRWIAYTSQDTQPSHVFVRPFPGNSSGLGGKWQISTDGGQRGTWSRSGNELVYLSSVARGPVVAPYTVQGDSFIASQSRPWSGKFPAALLQGPPELMPDGRHFVVILSASQPNTETQTHINFLLNFSDELRRRVPVH